MSGRVLEKGVLGRLLGFFFGVRFFTVLIFCRVVVIWRFVLVFLGLFSIGFYFYFRYYGFKFREVRKFVRSYIVVSGGVGFGR